MSYHEVDGMPFTALGADQSVRPWTSCGGPVHGRDKGATRALQEKLSPRETESEDGQSCRLRASSGGRGQDVEGLGSGTLGRLWFT